MIQPLVDSIITELQTDLATLVPSDTKTHFYKKKYMPAGGDTYPIIALYEEKWLVRSESGEMDLIEQQKSSLSKRRFTVTLGLDVFGSSSEAVEKVYNLCYAILLNSFTTLADTFNNGTAGKYNLEPFTTKTFVSLLEFLEGKAEYFPDTIQFNSRFNVSGWMELYKTLPSSTGVIREDKLKITVDI